MIDKGWAFQSIKDKSPLENGHMLDKIGIYVRISGIYKNNDQLQYHKIGSAFLNSRQLSLCKQIQIYFDFFHRKNNIVQF